MNSSNARPSPASGDDAEEGTVRASRLADRQRHPYAELLQFRRINSSTGYPRSPQRATRTGPCSSTPTPPLAKQIHPLFTY